MNGVGFLRLRIPGVGGGGWGVIAMRIKQLVIEASDVLSLMLMVCYLGLAFKTFFQTYIIISIIFFLAGFI